MPPRKNIQKSLKMTSKEASQKSSKRASRKASGKFREVISYLAPRKRLKKAPTKLLKKCLEPSIEASQEKEMNEAIAVLHRQPTICMICKRSFDSKEKLNGHNKKHHFFRHCPNCPKTFKKSRSFILHLQTHIGICPYECDICITSFLEKKEMLAHRKNHKNSVTFHCNKCSEVFPHINSLHRHQLSHNGPPYDCGYCNAVFSNISDKIAHHVNHAFICVFCCNEVVAFPNPTELAIHTFAVHRDDEHDPNAGNAMGILNPIVTDSTVKLEDDSGSDSMVDFSSDDDESNADMDDNYQKDAVESVYNLKHKNKFICFICYDLYPSSEQLKSHMKAHPWHPCNSCFKFFADAVSLEEHCCDFAAVPSFRCKFCNAENCEKNCGNIKVAPENNMNVSQSIRAGFPVLPNVPSDYSDSENRNLLYNLIDYAKSGKERLDCLVVSHIGYHNLMLHQILRSPDLGSLIPEKIIPYIEDLHLKFQDLLESIIN